MLNSCQDNFYTTFGAYPAMENYHERQSDESLWVHCKVNELTVEPLDKTSVLYANPSSFAAGTTPEAIEDTADSEPIQNCLMHRVNPYWLQSWCPVSGS